MRWSVISGNKYFIIKIILSICISLIILTQVQASHIILSINYVSVEPGKDVTAPVLGITDRHQLINDLIHHQGIRRPGGISGTHADTFQSQRICLLHLRHRLTQRRIGRRQIAVGEIGVR